MANRYAPYKVRCLTREPRRLYVKFTGTNDFVGEQSLTNTAPFNLGVVNVVGDANGNCKVSLGGSATSRDTYAHLAGLSLISDEADRRIGEVLNSQVNHATDPNVTFTIVDTDDANAIIANTKVVWLTIDLLDSTD